MNSLKVPESGWQFAGSGPEKGLPPQAFRVQLHRSVIESMVQSAQNGEDIRLSMGKTPTLQYGSNSHRIAPPADSADYELYQTKPFESTRRAVRIPTTTSLYQKFKPSTKIRHSLTENDADAKTKPSASGKASTPSSLDSDIEALQHNLAAHDAARERARVVGKLPDSKKASAKPKAKPISAYGSKTSSLPASPGLNGVPSPSLNPVLSVSQQAMERAKLQRFILVHELAVKDRTAEYLQGKWGGKQAEFTPTLEKVAEFNSQENKWTMRKVHWKELDVWTYKYDTQEERQTAIDNAVRQYDKQRMSASEPEWQKLLPKEERGKGKCLSRLQANLAKGPSQPGPKIKVHKAEGGSMSGDGLDSDKPKAGGEKMARSASNPLPKSKKVGAQEAQAKRLLGNSKSKAAGVQKLPPTKNKAAAAPKASGGRILSQEIIVNSDTSGDEASAPKAKVKAKAAPTGAAKAKDTVMVASRPPVKPPTKLAPAQAPAKRPAAEEDDSSSSSGTPLSKRIKPKQRLPAPRLPSDASLNSRGAVASSSSLRNKNTSPTKSSPLASSPPTNASDLETNASVATTSTTTTAKKRKAEPEAKPAAATKKRAVESVSVEILRKANKFKVYYQQYEALHHEISGLDNPPDSKLADLLDMRGRLETLKKEIYRECSPARD